MQTVPAQGQTPAAKEPAAPALQAVAVEDTLPPLRYQILKDGAVAGPDAVFSPGDSLALKVEAARQGRILVLRRTEDGNLRLLFPDQGQDNRVGPGGGLLVPIRAREEPGEDTLVLVLAPEGAAEAARPELRAPARAGALRDRRAAPPLPQEGVQIKLTIR